MVAKIRSRAKVRKLAYVYQLIHILRKIISRWIETNV